jgi:CheY-like chemotaxis protein
MLNCPRMPNVLVCATVSLEDELARTLIGREELFGRLVAASAEEARELFESGAPSLVLVDRDLPDAVALVRELARGIAPIIIICRTAAAAAGEPLLAAGAHAVVETPAGPDWDVVLGRLLAIPARSDARIPLDIQFEGESSGIETIAGTVVDLSVSGILVESDASLAVGAILDLCLHLFDAEEPITGCGQVVRVESPGRFGIRFFGLEGDGDVRIRRFVEGEVVMDEGE